MASLLRVNNELPFRPRSEQCEPHQFFQVLGDEVDKIDELAVADRRKLSSIVLQRRKRDKEHPAETDRYNFKKAMERLREQAASLIRQKYVVKVDHHQNLYQNRQPAQNASPDFELVDSPQELKKI